MRGRMPKSGLRPQFHFNWRRICILLGGVFHSAAGSLPAMSLLPRLFGPKKPATVQSARVDQVAAAVPDSARPVRMHVYREAYITYESGYRRKGVVMDFTDTGLRIRFPTNEMLPSVVSVNARSVGIEGEADVVWQKNTEAGLRLRS
jgi:hypothetical protein